MSDPARVLVLIDSLLAGGAERLAVETACALDRSRFEPHVLVTRGSGPLEPLLHDAGVPFTLLQRTSTFSSSAARRALRMAADSDIVHSHKFASNVWGALLARRAGVPLVAHEHNWGGGFSRRRALLDRYLVGATAHRLVCVSDTVAHAVRAHGVGDDVIDVVPNGVRLQAALSRAAARAELGLADDAWVAGIVAGLRPEKAHADLIDAVASLRGSGRPIELCIVGDGPCRRELERRADVAALAGAVTWAGERRDAARLAAAFDVAVICSHWEGLPLAALEALAAGIPLVASAVGGLPDLLAGDAGFLVDPPGVPALAVSIASVYDDPARAAVVGETGRQRVRSQHDFGAMVDRVQQIYDEALAHGARRIRRMRRRDVDTGRREAA